jgi:hypothetical protein
MTPIKPDPQPGLFFRWLALGLTAQTAGLIWLIADPSPLLGATTTPAALAWTHLMVLGWLCALFFGAGHPLIPVLTQGRNALRWVPEVHFWLHFAGIAWMIPGFATARYDRVGVGGTLVVVGFLLFAFRGIRVAGMQAKWTASSVFWTLSSFWLLTGAGLALAAVGQRLGWFFLINPMQLLGLHVHVLLFGFFLCMLFSASAKLLPMFLLGSEKNQWGTWVAGMILNALLFVAMIHAGQEMSETLRKQMCWIAWAVLFAYYAQLQLFVREGRRLPDAGTGLFLLSTLLLVPAWMALQQFHSGASFGQQDPFSSMRLSVLLVLLTFSGCILGMAQKMVPFMLWQARYAPHLGKAKLPLTADLLHPSTLFPASLLQLCSFVLYGIALWQASGGMIRVAAMLQLASLACFALNLPRLVSHWRKPRLVPLQPQKPACNP